MPRSQAPSDASDQPKFCEKANKVIYTSPHRAKESVRAAMRGSRFRVYRCEGHFHVTKRRESPEQFDGLKRGRHD